MSEYSHQTPTQRILVFQQNNSGESKIRGINAYGGERFIVETVAVDDALPLVIDNTGSYLPDVIDADLVLDYFKHPDLAYDLAMACKDNGIPEVATRQKITNNWTHSPPICCALTHHDNLGEYGRLFGAPEFTVEVIDGTLSRVSVSRGAPCGATWHVAEKITGLPVEEALQRIGLETQYACTADPADWDPLYGKSPVHLAAKFHTGAFSRALKEYGAGRIITPS